MTAKIYNPSFGKKVKKTVQSRPGSKLPKGKVLFFRSPKIK